jgi:hypothetical protein
MAENGKFASFAWDDQAVTGFEENVPNFPFLAMWCVLANVPQNCNGTWQRHNRVVCFSKLSPLK